MYLVSLILIRASYICGLYRDSCVFAFVTHVSRMTHVSSHSWLVSLWCLWFLFVPHASSHSWLMSPSWLICDSFVTHITLAGPVSLVTMSLGGPFVALFCIIVTRSWLVRDSFVTHVTLAGPVSLLTMSLGGPFVALFCADYVSFVTRSWLTRDSLVTHITLGGPVSLVTMSLGGPFVALFCADYVSEDWKAANIYNFVSVSGFSLSLALACTDTHSCSNTLSRSPALSHTFFLSLCSMPREAANIYRMMLWML